MKLKFLLTILSCIALQLHAQQRNEPYDFPVKPGTEAWKKFSSPEEAFASCQIPEGLLSQLNTTALAKTCLQFPLFGVVNAYNSPQEGFDFLKAKFNGVRELEKRKDAGKVLLALYKSMDPAKIDRTLEPQAQGKYLASFQYIEILLSQFKILEKLESPDRKMLLKEAKLKCDRKTFLKDIYGDYSISSSMLPASRLLSLEGKLMKRSSIDQYIRTGNPSVKDLPAIYKVIQENQR